MKHLIILVALILPALLALSQTASPAGTVTVADVITLSQAKVGDSVILAKLTQANHAMSLTTDQILQLKSAGVSDTVLRAMILPPSSAPATGVVVDNKSVDQLHSLNPTGATVPYGIDTPPAEDPLAPHDSGIYLASSSPDGKQSFQFLDRAGITGVQENVGAVFTFFTVPVTVSYTIQPPRSAIRTANPLPVFYFYFENKAAGLGKSAFSAANVSAPTQFQLVKFSASKKQRTLPAVKFGVFTGLGNGEKDIAFNSQQLRSGVYRVTPVKPLPPGEYTFIAAPAGQAPAAVNDPNAPKPDLFDFGIDAPSATSSGASRE